jgi:hypothetical protein
LKPSRFHLRLHNCSQSLAVNLFFLTSFQIVKQLYSLHSSAHFVTSCL